MGRWVTIDINILDEEGWSEVQHPRKKSGQFAPKGEGEAGAKKTKQPARIHKGLPLSTFQPMFPGLSKVHEIATTPAAEKDPHGAAAEMIAHAATKKSVDVYKYANKLLRAMEEKHGLPKGSLGVAVPKDSPIPPKMPEGAKPPPTPEPEAAKPEAPGIQPPEGAAATSSAAKKAFAIASSNATAASKAVALGELTKGSLSKVAQEYIAGLQKQLPEAPTPEPAPEPAKPAPADLPLPGPGSPISKMAHALATTTSAPELKAKSIKTLLENNLASGNLSPGSEGYKYGVMLHNELQKQAAAELGINPSDPAWASTVELMPDPQTPEPAKEPDPPPPLPLPHPESKPQMEMYQIASGPGTKEEKAQKLHNYATPMAGGYAEKYKQALIEHVAPGWTPPAPKPSPATSPTAKAPVPHPAEKTIQPAKPSASWHAGMKVLQEGVRNNNSSWDYGKAVKVMPTAEKAFWQSLPAKERNACDSYTGSGYTPINGALRDPEQLKVTNPFYSPDEILEHIHNIDACFEREEAKTKEHMVVHRGLALGGPGQQTIPIDKLKQALKLGLPAAFHWDGFVSTSFASSAAFSSKDVQVEIGVPKGSPALAFQGSVGVSGENEVLLPHGRSFQVLSIEELPGGKHKVKVVMK